MATKGEEDFIKKRKKVGKKNTGTKATNVNVRTKRIRIHEQFITREKSEIVNYRNKSLDDLVSQFTHFSANVRKDAVLGLRDLFAHNIILYSTSANVLITKSIKLLLDSDTGVRQALLSVYSTLLPNIPENQLLPFSDLLNSFINNGLTSINPSIQRSTILLIQILLDIDYCLFQSTATKLLSNMVKLISNTKPTTLPSRGILSSNRSHHCISSKEQQSLMDLTLETIQRLFIYCLSTYTIYNEFFLWCDHSQGSDSEYTQSFHFSLNLSVYKPSIWLRSTDSASPSNESLLLPMKSLLSVLFEAIANEVPSTASTSSFSTSSKLRSKVISETSLRKLSMLEELASNVFLVLERENNSLNVLEKLQDWRSLLYDIYPLRLSDSSRNEAGNRLLLQQTNELTALLILITDPIGENSNDIVHYLLDQDLVFVLNRYNGGEVRLETVQIRVGVLKRLYERAKDKKTIVEKANRMWSELIDHHLAQSSLPFIILFRYIVGCHDLNEYGKCFENVAKVLNTVPYSEEKESNAHAIWNNGMRLLLEGVKVKAISLSTLKLFQEVINSEVEVTTCSPSLQAMTRAILLYYENRK